MPTPALFLGEPRALWLLLLALPLVAAHLVRRRRVRVTVPCLALLLEDRGAVRGGGMGRRLADHAPLLCRLLALAALAVALAGPRPSAPPAPVPLVLVVDADVTSAARESDGRTRLAHALDLAAALVRAHVEGPVSVVVAGLVPRVLVQAEEDREGLARRLVAAAAPACEPARGAADLESALLSAWALAGDRGLVKVLTARALPASFPPASSAAAASGPASRLEALGTGAADEDQGFVDLRVTGVVEGPQTRLTLSLKNFAPRPATREVVLRVGELPEERRALTLGAGAEATVLFEVLVPRGGAHAVATLSGPDDFADNDRLEAMLAGPLRPSLLAVHAGAGLRPYTQAAIAALGEQIDREASGAVALADLGTARQRDVTLVDGAALPPEALRAGAWLFLAPLGGALPFGVGPVVERPIVWRARPGHPLVLDLDLADAWIQRATPLVPGPDVTGLAFAGEDQAILAEGERDGVRWVALGLEPEASDLPMRAAFPLLVRNALLRLARAPAEPLPPFVRAGEVLRPRVPLPGGPQARLSWPGRTAVDERLSPEVGVRVPAGLHGLLEVRTGSEAAPAYVGRSAVVDLDRARSIAPLRPPARPPAARSTPHDPGARWARMLILGASLLLALDLLLTRRARPGRAPGGSLEGRGPAGVAMSPFRGSIDPWKTESSARP